MASCSQQDASKQASIRVSAASSLTSVMKEIKKGYEAENPDHDITIQYASSGTLAHQLVQGAPSHLYISANEQWMNKVVQEELISSEDVQPLVKNRLILATHKGEDISFEDLRSVHQFAMGDPESVPAGAYAKQALKHRGIWEEVQNRAVYGKNVRQVASYIQSQNVEVGFVYQSDVQALKSVEKSQVIPESYHRSISYPMGVMKEAKRNPLLEDFLKYLRSPKAKDVFQSNGFVPIE